MGFQKTQNLTEVNGSTAKTACKTHNCSVLKPQRTGVNPCLKHKYTVKHISSFNISMNTKQLCKYNILLYLAWSFEYSLQAKASFNNVVYIQLVCSVHCNCRHRTRMVDASCTSQIQYLYCQQSNYNLDT